MMTETTATPARYMLDTNVFDPLTKAGLSPTAFAGMTVYSTHCQRNELEATGNLELKENLLSVSIRKRSAKPPSNTGQEKAPALAGAFLTRDLHWGVLSLGPDGSAIWKFEVSSLSPTDRWQGQFVLHDKEDNVLGTVPNSGTFDVEVRGVRPRRMEIVMPLQFEPAAFKRIGSVKMSMECGPKEA